MDDSPRMTHPRTPATHQVDTSLLSFGDDDGQRRGRGRGRVAPRPGRPSVTRVPVGTLRVRPTSGGVRPRRTTSSVAFAFWRVSQRKTFEPWSGKILQKVPLPLPVTDPNAVTVINTFTVVEGVPGSRYSCRPFPDLPEPQTSDASVNPDRTPAPEQTRPYPKRPSHFMVSRTRYPPVPVSLLVQGPPVPPVRPKRFPSVSPTAGRGMSTEPRPDPVWNWHGKVCQKHLRRAREVTRGREEGFRGSLCQEFVRRGKQDWRSVSQVRTRDPGGPRDGRTRET